MAGGIGAPPRTRLYLLALAGLTLLSRLPQLTGPNMLLDGDESLVGLMAKHVAQGEVFPIFVYGQQYGLATIETAFGALAFLLFGFGVTPLKVAMLSLWTIGVLFTFLTLQRPLGAARSFWIALVFVFMPAWADASMEAWGGYITAFTVSAGLMWLLLRDDGRMSGPRWLVAGVLTAVVYLGRPLWLPPVLPFIAVAFFARPRWRWGALYACALLGTIAAVKIATAESIVAFESPSLWNHALLDSLPGVARQIYVNLTGAYFLGSAREVPGPATALLARICFWAIPALALVQVYRLVTKRYNLLSHLLFASVCAALVVPWVMLFARDARYLLPLSLPLVRLVAVELIDLVDRRVLHPRALSVLTTAALMVGSISLYEFRSFNHLWPNTQATMKESERMRELIDYLQSQNVRHVYSMNGLLNYKLIFYSNERVLSRSKGWRVRYPAYAQHVDRALARGKTVAVVGYTDTSGAPGCWDVPICSGGIARLVREPDKIFTVDDKYFVYVGADKQLLKQLEFRFAE